MTRKPQPKMARRARHGKPVSVFGRLFPFALNASRESGIPYHALLRKLKDPDYPEFHYCTGKGEGGVSDRQFREKTAEFLEGRSRPMIFVLGKAFPTVAHACRATGLARMTLKKRLDDPRFPEFHYIEGSRTEEDEVSDRQFRTNLEVFRRMTLGRGPVCVFGKVFPFNRQAILETGISKSAFHRRLHDAGYGEIRYWDGKEQGAVDEDRFREKVREFHARPTGRSVSVFGRVFPSITRASRDIGVSFAALQKKLDDPNSPEFHYHEGGRAVDGVVSCEQFKRKVQEFRESVRMRRMNSMPVSVFGKVFPSIGHASVETGISRNTVKMVLDDPNWPGFQYHDGKQENKGIVIEREFREKVREFRRTVRRFGVNSSRPFVCVFGKLFPSTSQASRETGLSRRMLRKLLDDPTRPEFQYHDGKQESKDVVDELEFRRKVTDFRASMPKSSVPVYVFGKVFSSMSVASRETGMSRVKLRKMLNDPNRPEFQYHGR